MFMIEAGRTGMRGRPWARAGRACALAATLSAAAIAGVGCGGGAASSSGGDSGPIRVGVAIELTGSLAKNGAAIKRGYDLWAKTVNAGGGIEVGGSKRKVEVKYYDDQSDPQNAGKLISRMVTQDKTKLVFGPSSSGVTQVASAIAERNGALMLNSNTADTLFDRGLKLFVTINAPASTAFNPVVDLAHKRGAKTVAILALDDVFPQLQRSGIVTRAKQDGMTVVYNEKFPQGTQDFSTEIGAMKSKNPDAVLFSGYIDDTVLFRRQTKQLKFAPGMIAETTGPEYPDFTKSVGAAANCVFGYALWNSSYGTQGPVFGSAQKFADLYQQTYGEEPSPQAADAAALGALLQQAITSAGSTDPVAVRKALGSKTFQTVVGPYKDRGNGVNALASTAALQILDQKIKVVYPEKLAQASARYPSSTCYSG